MVDLARTECFRSAVVVADAALRAGTTTSLLAEVAGRCASWPGGAQAQRGDFLWRDAHTIGWADGAVKYTSRADLMAEKWQVERLENLGFEVVRWGWDEAYRGGPGFDRTISRARARGAAQQVDPGVRLVTTALTAPCAGPW